MRRRLLVSPNEGIKASEAMACDICLYNKTTDSLVIISNDEFNSELYPSDNYSPVGVVVVPGTHDVYEDESCGIVSLKYMSYDTPDNGSLTPNGICWGYSNNISELSNFNATIRIDTEENENTNTAQGVSESIGYIPSDIFDVTCSFTDNDAYYDKTLSTSNNFCPSSYFSDETINEVYSQTSSPSSSKNALSDFNGYNNNQHILTYATSQSNWKTSTTISNFSSNGYYPAACCCWRYHTDGTKQGDWYLPAMGELGYLFIKLNKINTTIKNIMNVYGSNVGVEMSIIKDESYYWCSTEYSATYGRYLYFYNGSTNYNEKNKKHYVRAFIRVK